MARKVISIILTLLFLLSVVTPVFADETPAWVNCRVSQEDNKVTFDWGGTPTIREIKIFRDGSVFKDFTNIPSSYSFEVIETDRGLHKYKAIAYKYDKSEITRSSEYSVDGFGSPKIRLEFIDGFKENNIEGPSYSRIYNWVYIYNDGSMPLDIKKLKIRYFYTIDGESSNGQILKEASDQRLNPNYDFNDGQIRDVTIPKEGVDAKFTKMARPMPKTDYFCQIYFPNTDLKINSNYKFSMQPAFDKKLGDKEDDIRNYDFENDYSYKESQNIAVYYDNELIWGNDPSVIVPTKLTAVFDVSKIRLNWDTCPGAIGYIVYRSETGKDNEFTAIGTVDTPGTSDRQTYFDENIQSSSPDRYDGKDYYYKVKAVYDEGVKSGYSNMAKVTADPFSSNPYWALNLQIIGKSAMSPYFALGTYIPVKVTLTLKQNISNPTILLRDEVCEVTTEANKLNAKLVPKNSGSSYLRASQSNVIISSNTIQFPGNYDAGSELFAEFVLKVSPSQESLSKSKGINGYYGKWYKLQFGIKGWQNGSTIEPENSDKTLEVIILKPDKLK